jgi:23S rRNA (cytidine1920-2'-O)/16S rRNA (cytidine1409-2'-O)-methyltransferase
VTRRLRLDAELVRRGLARSRDQACELIAAGRVSIAGVPAVKPSTAVAIDAAVVVAADTRDPGYVSRGGYKLAGALDALEPKGLRVAGRVALDAGASTGGFTDVLLRRGAASVIAVDVGYGQLAWSLRQDPRVVVLERTNVRDLVPGMLPDAPGLVVADLSFISLGVVLAPLVGVATVDADVAAMVKPQFEVGRAQVGKGGVVRDQRRRADAVIAVAERATALGLGVRACCPSPLPGPAGNVEYFLWLQRGGEASGVTTIDADAIRAVVAEGPQ